MLAKAPMLRINKSSLSKDNLLNFENSPSGKIFFIVDEFIEKRSAKIPGRPIFNEILSRIQNGEAQGIVCWKIDRLSRNPVDSGKIQWMLQQNINPTYTNSRTKSFSKR